MLNKCVLMGRLTKDPEIRYTQGADPVAVAKFSIAVERNYQKNGEKSADFFDIEAWRQKAEFAEKYLRKGLLIVIEGSFQQYFWEDRSGSKRSSYKLVADNFYFAEGKKPAVEKNAQNPSGNIPSSAKPATGFDPYADAANEKDFDPFGDGDMNFYVS